jgi:hypothetical protein
LRADAAGKKNCVLQRQRLVLGLCQSADNHSWQVIGLVTLFAEVVPLSKMTKARTEEKGFGFKGGHEKKKDAAGGGLCVSWS